MVPRPCQLGASLSQTTGLSSPVELKDLNWVAKPVHYSRLWVLEQSAGTKQWEPVLGK